MSGGSAGEGRGVGGGSAGEGRGVGGAKGPTPTVPLLPAGLTAADVDFAKGDGLVPGVVQHARTGQVLMVGFLDERALVTTLSTGLATFWSRSRSGPWTKGETSGNTLAVEAVEVDCDRDTLLLLCIPSGPTCHTGDPTCFGPDALHPTPDRTGVEPAHSPDRPGVSTAPDARSAGSFLRELDAVVAGRREAMPKASYTTALFTEGVRRIAQKVGEEGVETALAAVAEDDQALLGESADLIYHLLVLLRARGLGLTDVERVLQERHG